MGQTGGSTSRRRTHDKEDPGLEPYMVRMQRFTRSVPLTERRDYERPAISREWRHCCEMGLPSSLPACMPSAATDAVISSAGREHYTEQVRDNKRWLQSTSGTAEGSVRVPTLCNTPRLLRRGTGAGADMMAPEHSSCQSAG